MSDEKEDIYLPSVFEKFILVLYNAGRILMPGGSRKEFLQAYTVW